MSGRVSEGEWTAPLEAAGRARASELRRLYRAYRLRESQAFLRLIPREGIRPLYGAARAWAKEREIHDGRDPMSALLAYVLEILPLPPFEVWVRDREANRFDHLVARATQPAPVRVSRPATVDRRTFRHRRRRWAARLKLFRAGGGWRGYIAFQPDREATAGGTGNLRTTDIFVDADPSAIRDRFREYRDDTLRGFLRSVLP